MSDGELLSGQSYEPGRRQPAPYPFTEQMVDHSTLASKLGDATSDISPRDRGAWLVRKYNVPTDSFDDFVIDEYDSLNLNGMLPDVLESIEVKENGGYSEGEATESGRATTTGTTAALSMNLSARSNASISRMPIVLVRIRRPFYPEVGVRALSFYMPESYDEADLLTKINLITGLPVLPWPTFRPVSETIVATGGQATISVGVSLSQSVSAGQTNTDGIANANYTLSKGTSESTDINGQHQIQELPPTIHPAITLDFTPVTPAVYATSNVSIEGVEGFFPSQTVTRRANPVGILPSVEPRFFPATTGATSIPTTGVYLFPRIQSESADFDYRLVRVFLVDFATL